MEKLELPVADLARLAGLKSAEELVTKLKDGEEELPEDAGSKAVKLVGDRIKVEKKAQYNRGIGEKGKSLDKIILPILEEMEIEAPDRIEESIPIIVEKAKAQAEPVTTEPGELTKEAVLKSPHHQEVVNGLRDKHKDQMTTLTEEFNKYKTDQQQFRRNAIVQSKVASALDDLNAKFSDDKEGDLDFFFRAVGFDQFKLSEDGKSVVIVDKDGDPELDNYGQPKSVKDWVQENWRFGFDEVDPSQNGSRRRAGSRKSGEQTFKFKDQQDFEQQLSNTKDRKVKSEMQRAWSEQLSGGSG